MLTSLGQHIISISTYNLEGVCRKKEKILAVYVSCRRSLKSFVTLNGLSQSS